MAKRLTDDEIAQVRRLVLTHGIGYVARKFDVDPRTVCRATAGDVQRSATVRVIRWLLNEDPDGTPQESTEEQAIG
jgi:hypothetical protein